MFAELGQIAKSALGSRVLLVTDPGIVATGMVDRAVAMLGVVGLVKPYWHRAFHGGTANRRVVTTHSTNCLPSGRPQG